MSRSSETETPAATDPSAGDARPAARTEPGATGVADGGASSDAGGAIGVGGVGPIAASGMDAVPRRARWFVGFLLLALAVPGVIGFEAWPLTGWRLFSLARDDSQTAWVLDAVDGRGDTHAVEVEQLPLRYRHAEWPMAELPDASTARQEAVCQALLGAVVDLEPDTVALDITRDRQHMVERDGEWTVTHDPEVIHTCRVADADIDADAGEASP